MPPLIVIGCGYVGSRIARAALAAGDPVRACARSTGRLQPLGAAGAEVKYLDVAIPKQLPQILAGLPGATVIYSIPPVLPLPPGLAVRNTLQAAYGAGAAAFIYFSSSGLYGALPDDDVWIDEDTPVVHDDEAMKNVLSDEDEISRCTFGRMRLVMLRLAPVYGPGRGVRARLAKGDYRLLDDGSHAISRIHVDDVARIVFAAAERAPDKSTYIVADDEPTTQRDYAGWLCERMSLPLPPSRSLYEPGASRVAHRNRKLRNTKLKRELGLELRYPSFREGEVAIEAELAAK
ncbi:MAG TPA: NAD-dependent epimerase/dehydratase family protein [Kofleriaceae bacterium]|nr:NAD-dependent epimerase/dehydratase family protein [Kofleriaceae bacterium]